MTGDELFAIASSLRAIARKLECKEKNTERHLVSDFTTYTEVRSKILPWRTVSVAEFHCPRCDKITSEPEHGQHDWCDFCGLQYIAWGNALYISDDMTVSKGGAMNFIKLPSGMIINMDNVSKITDDGKKINWNLVTNGLWAYTILDEADAAALLTYLVCLKAE